MVVRKVHVTVNPVVLLVGLTGCATAPFSVPSPALSALEAEEPFLYESPDRAIVGLSQSDLPHLSDRIGNLFYSI